MAEGPSNPTFLHENLSPLLLPSYPREIVNNFKETPIFTVSLSEIFGALLWGQLVGVNCGEILISGQIKRSCEIEGVC